MNVTPNRPEVVAEMADRSERCEQALIDQDVTMLDAPFRDLPDTIRYALRDNSATANIESKRRGREGNGRGSKTWIRFPGLGWKVIAAHVPIMPGGGW